MKVDNKTISELKYCKPNKNTPCDKCVFCTETEKWRSEEEHDMAHDQ